MPASPLIVTLALDEAADAFFNELRQTHFPPERNYLKAHLTLFHHLPPDEPAILANLENWSISQSEFVLPVTTIVSIGNGVAYKIDCPPLIAAHQVLQKAWQPWLIPQDKQKLWPHVTVQNKVTPTKAAATLRQLQETFVPFKAVGIGLNLWSYEDGPWQFIQHFAFEKLVDLLKKP